MFSTKAAGSLLATAGRGMVLLRSNNNNTTLLSPRFATTTTTTATARCKATFSSAAVRQSRRWMTTGKAESSSSGSSSSSSSSSSSPSAPSSSSSNPGWWSSPQFWGACGALAGWGMSGAAIYDASLQGPEVISLTMTPVLIVYSSLFARWAWVVQPRNLLLMWCHVANVAAQSNQLRRALEFKMANGQEEQVHDMVRKVGLLGVTAGAAIVTGPSIRKVLTNANLGVVSSIAAADAGPFTVHFWAPMSKWFISGASFMDLHRPTDNISLPQYTALTFTGFFFTRYALLVTPINYTLCSVNIALFLSSAWHLGRKIKADFIDDKQAAVAADE